MACDLLRRGRVFALLERDDGFLPMRTAPEVGAAFTLLLAGVVGRVDRRDLLLEEALDGRLDLEFVRLTIYFESVSSQLFLLSICFLS